MSTILDTRTIDAMAEEKGCIILFIFDHLDWENEGEHLMILQDKINVYIEYMQSKQYKKIMKYKFKKISGFIIDIKFKYDITPNCKKFIDIARNTVYPIGGDIRYDIRPESV